VNPIADWSNFLIAVASAAAALTGLIFVAISINLTKILQLPGVSIRASEALIILLGILLISIVALAPNQPPWALATEILAIGAVSWIKITQGQIRSLSLGLRVPVWLFAMRVSLFQLALLPIILTGLSLAFGWRNAMFWLIPGCVFSFVVGVHSAWVILIEILR